MIVTLIPFLLIARIPVEENAWKFGPEYTFQLTANSTGKSENDLIFMSNTTALLRCRPKELNALSCHLQNPESFYKNNPELKKKPLSEEQFEVIFNNAGANSLIVQKNISIWNLNIIKSFVNQFSIGVDLSEKVNQETFETKENSTIGECKVNYKIVNKPKEQSTRIDNPFILNILPMPDKVVKGDVEIEKIRNLKDCMNYTNYLWGNFGDDKLNSTEIGIDTQLDSVIAKMNITVHSFTSCTHTEATKGSDSTKRKLKVVETISLTLKNIEAAKDKLPAILNPGTTPIFTKINVQEPNAQR